MLKWTSLVTANAASATSVAGSQTPSGAGNLTLTSSSVTFGTSSAQYVTIISGSNISNRTLTITGTDIYDNVFSQTLTGPNNATVTSTLAFKTVTNVSISGSAAGALTVGNSAYAEGQMYVPDFSSNPMSIGFGTAITSGTPTWTVQHTFADVMATGNSAGISGPQTTAFTYSSTSNIWYNHPIVAAVTANVDGNYAFPVTGIKLTLSAAGAVRIRLLQSGGGVR
jgi:hypothetical protein